MDLPDRARSREIASIALAAARDGGADYADVRVARHRRQDLFARNERLASVEDRESAGVGVRALMKGSWGFAATAAWTEEGARSAGRDAAAIARAGARATPRPVLLAPEPPARGECVTPRVHDPLEVPLEEKSALLLSATEAMRREEAVKLATAFLVQIRQWQLLASTEGADHFRDRCIVEGTIQAHAAANGDRQTRAYAAPAAHAGWERILASDLPGNAPRVAREAREKCFAAGAPEGRLDLILDPDHLWLTIHESIGHATELDRVLGYEADYAGTSFATTDKRGSFRYGSPAMNAVADNVTPEYLASTGTDDDGVAGQRWDIVREGILAGYATSREVAPLIGDPRSRGACRAEGWHAVPIVRIPNLGILPGKGRAEELIADTKDGILIHGDGSWSIDQRRLNFQFGGDLFWRIRGGRRAEMLKNVVYRSSTPAFWNALDAVCGPEEFRAVGCLTCGKGQPGQSGLMTHFSSTSRFRGIEVGRGGGS